MKKYILLGSIFILFWAAINYTAPEENQRTIAPLKMVETIPHKKPQDSLFQQFTDEYLIYFKELLKKTNTPGVGLLIVKDNKTYFMDGLGLKEIRKKDSIDVNTVFRLGSLSKGFAGILTGILVENNILNWEDIVNDYLPDFQLKDSSQTRRINLLHLLSHTTGLPYHAYTDLVEKNWDLEYISKRFCTVNLIAKEGEIYAYQNAAYSLIGEIMEKATGKDVTTLLKQELFDPLSMQTASSSYEDLINNPNIAQPHFGGYGLWTKRKISKKYYKAIPAGGINASINDMNAWMQLLLGNRPDIIANHTLDKVFTPYIKTRNKRRYFQRWPFVDTAYYGLGWRIISTKEDNSHIVYHGGYVNGYKTEIAFHRDDKVGICLLTNAPSQAANESIPAFWKKYFDFKAKVKIDEQVKLPSDIEIL